MPIFIDPATIHDRLLAAYERAEVARFEYAQLLIAEAVRLTQGVLPTAETLLVDIARWAIADKDIVLRAVLDRTGAVLLDPEAEEAGLGRRDRYDPEEFPTVQIEDRLTAAAEQLSTVTWAEERPGSGHHRRIDFATLAVLPHPETTPGPATGSRDAGRRHERSDTCETMHLEPATAATACSAMDGGEQRR